MNSVQPRLQEVEIQCCYSLKDITFAKHTKTIKSFELRDCPYIKDVSMIGYVKYLKIADCTGIRSVKGLSGTSIQRDERTIILDGLRKLKDFSPLHDIHRLELTRMSQFNNMQRIYNIDHLYIDRCGVTRSDNFVNIRESLTIKDCEGFSDEGGRSDIPVVKVISNKNADSNIGRIAGDSFGDDLDEFYDFYYSQGFDAYYDSDDIDDHFYDYSYGDPYDDRSDDF